MFYRDDLQQLIDKGLVPDEMIKVVRKQGKIFDVVLEGEPVRPWEVVTVEKVADVLMELPE